MKRFAGAMVSAAILFVAGLPAGGEERTIAVRASVVGAIAISTSASMPGEAVPQAGRIRMVEGAAAVLSCRNNAPAPWRKVMVRYAVPGTAVLSDQDPAERDVREIRLCGMRIQWDRTGSRRAAPVRTGFLTIEP